MQLKRKDQYSPDRGEKIAGERLTESAGYVPAKVRIEEMIQAGERLVDYRRGRYDFPPGKEVAKEDLENYMDPTRSPNFDLADGSQIAMQTAARLDESFKSAKLAAKADKAKKIDSEPAVKAQDGGPDVGPDNQ